MSNVNDLLSERMNKNKRSLKVTALAKQSADGSRSGFAGIFGTVQLSPQEKETIEDLLNEYSTQKSDVIGDMHKLFSLSSEVKAINHQATLLHGERIKKAQEILKSYREGAFTEWMLAIYGNRQTPYNFLQFYEFYQAIPKNLHPQIELMPRQAIYTLATRDGDFKKKQKIVETYQGETKEELLEIIREIFPLKFGDRRKIRKGEKIVSDLKAICGSIARHRTFISKKQRVTILDIVKTIQGMIRE